MAEITERAAAGVIALRKQREEQKTGEPVFRSPCTAVKAYHNPRAVMECSGK